MADGGVMNRFHGRGRAPNKNVPSIEKMRNGNNAQTKKVQVLSASRGPTCWILHRERNRPET